LFGGEVGCVGDQFLQLHSYKMAGAICLCITAQAEVLNKFFIYYDLYDMFRVHIAGEQQPRRSRSRRGHA
jgi:hypothetical protein